MKKFNASIFLFSLFLFCTAIFSKAEKMSTNEVPVLKQVIEKIKTTPSTSDMLDGETSIAPALIYDGSAVIYFKPGYYGKVDRVEYKTNNLEFKNPVISVKAGDNKVVIKDLRRSVYELVAIYLKDGKVITAPGVDDKAAQEWNFKVYSLDKKFMPLGGQATDYTSNMEGERISLFAENFKEVKASTGNNLFDCNTFTLTATTTPAPCNSMYAYTFTLKNDCTGQMVYAYCKQHLTAGGTVNVNDKFQWVNGLLQPINNPVQILDIFWCNNSQCDSKTLSLSGGTLFCAGSTTHLSATITGGTLLEGTWTGPNNYWLRQPEIDVNTAGTYTYTAYITGPFGEVCTIIKSITVASLPAPAAPTATVVNPGCGQTTGSITITPVSGATYSFDNGATYQTSYTKSSLAPGTYLLKIRSSAGCVSAATSATITAAPATPAAPTATVVDPACGQTTGTITITPIAGATYSFDNGATYQTSNSKVLPPGTYTLRIKSAAGCISEGTSVTITATTPAAPIAAVVSPTSCGQTMGSISITPVAGATYSFDNGATYQSTYIKFLPPGTYLLRIKSATGCVSAATSATITAGPAIPAAPTATVINPGCGQTTGTITITPVSGATYSFDNGATYQVLNSKSGLLPGTYSLKIKSAAGCESAVTLATITAAPAIPAAPTATVINPVCGQTTGTITITPVAGATYSFDNGATYQTSNSKSGLLPGTYSLRIKSAAGCVSGATSATIAAAPAGINVTITSNQGPCPLAASTLTAVANPSIGATYSWRQGTVSGTVIGTSSSVTVNPSTTTFYYVIATAASGCSDTASIAVNPVRPTLSITNIITICKGSSTDVRADNGGLAGYTYRWLTPASVAGVTNPVLTNQSPAVTTNYTVERTSPNGCKDTATSILNVVEAPVITAVVKADANCSTDNGQITVTANSPSNQQLEYSINGNTWQASNVFSNLAPGTYTVLVRNKNGICGSIAGNTVTIVRIGGPTGDIVGPNTRCALDPALFQWSTAIAGATWSWSATGSPVVTGGSTNSTYAVQWNTAGVYSVYVTVSLNGCSKKDTFNISVTPAVVVNAGPDKTICKGGATRIGTNPPPGSPTVTYSWYPATGLSSTTDATPIATPTQTTTYTVTVTDVINGCTKTDDVTVIVDVQLNPRANAGPDQTVTSTITSVPLGSVLTTDNPWNGYAIDYLWTELTPIDNNAVVNPINTKLTTFTYVPAQSTRTNWSYELLVRKFVPRNVNDPSSVDQYCMARDTVNIVKITAVPDLTPTLIVLPSSVVGNNQILECRIRVREVLGVSTTTTPVFVSIPLSNHYTLLPYDPTLTMSAGNSVQNSDWKYYGIINGNYFFQYIGTSLIGPNGSSALGFSINYSANGTGGKEYMVVSIADGSGGENNFLNNKDEEVINFAPATVAQ